MSLSLEEKMNKIVPNCSNVIISIQTAFENLMLNDKIVKPFLLVYDDQDKKPLISFTRAWLTDNPADYFSAIAEILFIIPAINTKSYMLAIHPKSNPFFNANKSYPLIYENSIILFSISEDFGAAVEIEYELKDNSVSWKESNYIEIVDIKDILIEVLFVYSHIDNPPFEYLQTLEYLSSNGFSVMINDETSKVNLKNNLSKGIFTP